MADFLDFFNVFIMGALQMFTGFHFFTGFLQKKRTPLPYLLFAPFCMGIILLRPGKTADFFAYVLLLSAIGILICKSDWATAVLYAVITAAVMQFCYGIFDSALCLLHPLMAFFPPKPAGIFFLLLGNLALPAAILCYRATGRHFACHEPAENRYALLLLAPALTLLFLGHYISSAVYGNTVTSDKGAKPAGADSLLILLIQLLGTASLFCILFACRKLSENGRLHTQLSLLNQEENTLRQYVGEAKTRWEKTRSFRHDIRNHLAMIKSLLQGGKQEQALAYIADMEGMAEALSFPCSTNHPTVDILIGSKLGLAREMGIDAYCSLSLPYPCPVRDIDFCILLSNALDNAIHACRTMKDGTEKYIRLSGRTQGDFLLLETENSFQGDGAFREGTGLSNIRTVAAAYQGAVSITAKDSVFLLSVLLILPRHPEDISRQNH